MDQREDNRTLAELAREALSVQDACNLSGVALSFGRAVVRLRRLLEVSGEVSTTEINRHPVCVLWASKIESLAGTRYSEAYGWAQRECDRAPVVVEGDISFPKALESWLSRSQQCVTAKYRAEFPDSSFEPPVLSIDSNGTRYVRIVRTEGASRNVFAFVERRSGDVLKASSWARPAKGARRNIYTDLVGVGSTLDLYC